MEKEYTITIARGGEAEMSWIQNICSCGWTGQKHYAYCSYQHSNYREEAFRHSTYHRTSKE